MPYCVACGNALADHHRFCSRCGARVEGTAPTSIVPVAGPPSRPSVAPQDSTLADVPVVHQPGSVFQIGRGDPGLDDEGRQGPLRRALPFVLLLAILTAGGVAGYLWTTRRPTVAATHAVHETEQRVGAPAAANARLSAADSGQPPADRAQAVTSSGTAEGRCRVAAEPTKDVKHAEDALGAPDERTAAIAPAGVLAITCPDEEAFFNGPGPDVRVYGPAGDRTPYTIFARSTAEEKWVRFDVNTHGFRDGSAAHDIGHHGLPRATGILIRNDGGVNLYIDAVVRAHTEAQPERQGDAHHHERAR